MYLELCKNNSFMQNEPWSVIIRFNGLVEGSVWVYVLYDSLEFVLSFFWDVKDKNDLGQVQFVFVKLPQFKYVYILYFLANILHF